VPAFESLLVVNNYKGGSLLLQRLSKAGVKDQRVEKKLDKN